MYTPPKAPRSYKRGRESIYRSYAIATTEMVSGVKSLGDVVAEKVKDLYESNKNNKKEGKSKFARILEIMRGNASKIKGKTRRGNPKDKDDVEGIEEMTSQFHGRPPIESMEVIEDVEYEDRLAILADLLELGILSNARDTIITINFSKNRPKLTCDALGTNLQLVGGDQQLDLRSEDYGGKELIPVGYCVSIAYETDKHHLEDSNGSVEGYEHYFGEEFYKENGYSGDKFFKSALKHGLVGEASRNGYLPMVLYDTRNERILIAGGKYKVEDVGIRD